MKKEDAENIKTGLEEVGEWLSENATADKDDLVKKIKKVQRLSKNIDRAQRG